MDQWSSLSVAPLGAQLTLNVEKFIKDIFDSQVIWNCTGARTGAHWCEIALQHNVSVEFLKRKWANLRKSFRNELKKIPRNGRNEYLQDPRLFSSNWPHYLSMLFLVDKIRLQPISEIPFKTSVNAATSPSWNFAGNKRRNIDYVDDENDDDFETINTTPFSSAKKSRYEDDFNDHEKLMTSTADMKSEDKEVNEEATEDLPRNNSHLSLRSVVRSVDEEIEETPDVFEIPSFKPKGSESDYHFLMSLHHFMENVNPLRKLHVRGLMQKILKKELQAHN